VEAENAALQAEVQRLLAERAASHLIGRTMRRMSDELISLHSPLAGDSQRHLRPPTVP
jgi:hypothetical protein